MTTTQQRPARFPLDFGLLATLALCLFTLWPLLYRPGLPNGTDTLYHIYRVAEMDRAWTHGVLAPQWAEAFYTGYGSPVFHYYASLSYYSTSILMRLFALDAVNALRLLTAVAMLLAGGGMYLFMRSEAGKLAGVIAAVVYVYSPYLLSTEAYTRGAYPEMLALALFPLVLWRYSRLMRRGSGLDLLLAALSSGALIITHNLMALVLTGLLVAWTLWQLVSGQRSGAVLSALALAFGVGLGAYFWLPVIAEQEAVRLGNLTAVAQLDYRNFFVPLGEVLGVSPRADAGAINGLIHRVNLGPAQWLLALAGVVGTIIMFGRRRTQRPTEAPVVQAVSLPDPHPKPLSLRARGFVAGLHPFSLREKGTRDEGLVQIAFWTLMALIFVGLMLPLAEILWRTVTPLAYLQFPWRFVGPAGICLAVLAGYSALWVQRLPPRFAGLLTTAGIVLTISLALPTLYIDEWEHETVDTTVAAYHEAELQGLQRGTTFSNEYLPSTVLAEPGANARLLADYADGYPVDKTLYSSLPEGVTVTALDHGPQWDSWQIDTPEAFTFEVLTYYFPGWQAYVNGEAVDTQPSEPHGLISFEIPPGDHRVDLRLEATPPRRFAQGVSLLALLLLATSAVIQQRVRPSADSDQSAALPGLLRWALVGGGVIQVLLVVLLMRPGLAWVDSPPGTALIAQDQTRYRLGESIELLGVDLNRRIFRPGERLELVLYWYAAAPIEYGYASFVHVTDGGMPQAQADRMNPAGRPTVDWTSEGYIRDDYIIDLPETIPPGEYRLTAGLYTCETRPPGECGNGDRLIVYDDSGEALGDSLPLATIEILP